MSSTLTGRVVRAAALLLVTLFGACAGVEEAPPTEAEVVVRSPLADDPAWIELDALAGRHGFRRVGTTGEGRIRLSRNDCEVQIDPQSRVSFFAGQLVLMSERPRQDEGGVWVAAALEKDFQALDRPVAKVETRPEPPVVEKLPTGRLAGRHFVIDPGHGGKDEGASSGGVKEKHVVLDVALQLGRLLEERGAKVTYTRRDDRFIELDDRAAISNRARPDAFVSIHVNSAGNRNARGVEVYRAQHRGAGARADKISGSANLARAIEAKLAEVTPVKDRGVKDSPGYRVLKLNDHPAVLLELGFVTNAEERARLGNAAYRRRLAEAILLGLETWSAGR
ncbi:MAG: N-acetylmuramoyl-L-alanine amidase [Planctomycetes bacterium]|nr:N-acetylmuramoyl-L-alanine amidase [Planctomycetota bacterium]